MDEKELIKRIKNSFRIKKSRTEILNNFQKRGYKLAYADKLISKAKLPKRIAVTLLITLVIFFSLTFSVYTIFSDQQKIPNPLSDFIITGNAITNQQIKYDQIEITPDFISFILIELGIRQLHKNPLTFENPIINFKINTKTFHSEIGIEIKTHKGLSDTADLQFNTNKQDLINAIISDNPEQVFKQSITSGETQVELKASKIELGLKGYLKLYKTLNFQSPL